MRTEDLRRQLADAADTLPIPPQDPMAAVRSRIRRRHRPRTLTRFGIVAVIVLAALGGTIMAIGSQTHTSRVLTGPGTTITTRPPGGLAISPVRMVAGPPGWQPTDYGDARLWVPADWQITACPRLRLATPR